MVERGSLHPESVIDLAARKREGKGKHSFTVSEGGFPLALNFLIERLKGGTDKVQMWAAYQLVERWPHESNRFVKIMWESHTEEIRELAIHLIIRDRNEEFSFPLLREFEGATGTLKNTLGQALGKLSYQPAEKSLHRWFQAAVTRAEIYPPELEAASKALLEINGEKYWDEVLSHLQTSGESHTIHSALFEALAENMKTPRQVEQLTRAYRYARETFHDLQFTRILEKTVGSADISRYMRNRITAGFFLPGVYQETLNLLGFEAESERLKSVLTSLGSCINTPGGVKRFLPLAATLIEKLVPESAGSENILAFFRGVATWLDNWDEAILKVREQEFYLILSLPLLGLLARTEAECLAEPDQNATRIIRIYQSPLLTPDFMRNVLSLISVESGSAMATQASASPVAPWLRDEEKDALWKLLVGQLDGLDYPFEQILPQPWDYRIPQVMTRLETMLKPSFSHFVSGNRQQAVGYSLELFRRVGSESLVELLLTHFDTLINCHYHAFMDVLTHLPDLRFLPFLTRQYREGENDLEQLIRFMCDVHGCEVPLVLPDGKAVKGIESNHSTVRLYCSSCKHAYQYMPHTMYVNEERLEQRQMISPKDIWASHPFRCKNCNSQVPFLPEEQFLMPLYTELLTHRLLQLPEDKNELSHVRVIPFPMLGGKSIHPDDFLKKVQEALARGGDSPKEAELLVELGRFYLEIGEMTLARQAFAKVPSGTLKKPWALYYLGVVAFHEKNPYEARVSFSRLVHSSSAEDFEGEQENPVEMAGQYLKLLDQREYKREYFRLIST